MNQKTMRTTSATLASLLLGLSLLAFNAIAAPKTSSLNIVPTITNIELVNGQLLASGFATANIKGRQYTAPFSNVPVNIRLAPDQTGAPVGCPILNLELGPINLNLLGLIVETSPICLTVTAYGGQLLGDLLCGIANLLNQNIPLNQILGALDVTQAAALTGGLTHVLNSALQNLLQAVLTGIGMGGGPRECAILNLELGPVQLNLLGLELILDDCDGGPVTVDITARRGALLGNLLCNLLGRGQITLGTLLDAILGQLLDLGPL
jgi:hypothetical protein